MANWLDDVAFYAGQLSDAELRDKGVSMSQQCTDICTEMMLHTSSVSHTIATRYRDWMVRCQVINFQLRHDFQHARKDVWSMIVELRHLVFEHIPRCNEELDVIVREKLEQ